MYSSIHHFHSSSPSSSNHSRRHIPSSLLTAFPESESHHHSSRLSQITKPVNDASSLLSEHSDAEFDDNEEMETEMETMNWEDDEEDAEENAENESDSQQSESISVHSNSQHQAGSQHQYHRVPETQQWRHNLGDNNTKLESIILALARIHWSMADLVNA